MCRALFVAVLVLLGADRSSAINETDAVLDWNITAGEIVVGAKLPPPPSNRVMAMVQVAVYEAVNAITKQYSLTRLKLDAAASTSIDAAVAAANRAMLLKLIPSQQVKIDSAYQKALSAIPDTPMKSAGTALGERAAAGVLELRADDVVDLTENYRPHTTAGVYVPTVIPAVSQWPMRKPWVMVRADQFRPEPPPIFSSLQWAHDFNEIKSIGGKSGSRRTAEQTDIARFWEATAPTIYYGVVHSVASMPGREITQNARLLAAAAQAMDDAIIAVFDAKYHYNFWRPITAIRNGDNDGNDATERDASWLPFIDTPMHPEYPCAHCIVAAAVGAVLRAEIGKGLTPKLSTTSPTAPGMVRSWTQLSDFVQEVSNARIYDGVHFRTSTEVGASMGQKIGELVATKFLQPLNK